MTFQLAIFLYIYYGFLTIWLIFILTAVYHILKFGFKTVSTLSITALFLLVAISILIISQAFISQIDWQIEITLFNSFTQPNIIID
ncbi:hypothetical protein KAR28_01610 [Candidatus Parcubacteria bacterium]|nr:hypothetical protein [Candidatus Parcubacteria bacterium]